MCLLTLIVMYGFNTPSIRVRSNTMYTMGVIAATLPCFKSKGLHYRQ